MLYFKKLIFAFPFLGLLFLFFYQLKPFLAGYDLIFTLDVSTLYQILAILASLAISCLMFTIFAGLNNWRYVSPVIIIASLIPLAVFQDTNGLIIMVGLLLSLPLNYFLLFNKLKTYVNFSASQLFVPSIKNLATLILLTSAIAFYFAVDAKIKQDGFKIPDSIIDTALQFAMPKPAEDVQGIQIAQVPNLTPEQIEFLKQNPDLLRQQGLDPSILNSIPANSSQNQNSNSNPSSAIPAASTTPGKTTTQVPVIENIGEDLPNLTSNPTNELIKGLVQAQFEKMIEPYEQYIPAVLAVLFFITFQSLFSLLSILLPLIVSLTFLVLEKSKFIKFTVETREVKKMTV